MFADNFNGYYPTVMRSLLRRVLRAERDAVPPDEHIDTFHKGGGGLVDAQRGCSLVKWLGKMNLTTAMQRS